MAVAAAGLFPATLNLSPLLLLLLAPCVLVAIILITTYLFTTIRYRLTLLAYTSTSVSHPLPPPRIPYTLPWLGSSLSFLAPRPGLFWTNLFLTHPRATGACTLLLGGRSAHVLFSPSAVQTLFKTRGPDRHSFNKDVVNKGLGISIAETELFYGAGEGPQGKRNLTPMQQVEALNHDFLLKNEAVNELTAEFTRVLRENVKEVLVDGAAHDTGLYAWLRPRMFTASTTALMGEKMLEMYPGLLDDFFDFDSVFLSLFFGIPKWIIPDAYRLRTRLMANLKAYQIELYERSKGVPVDPEGDVSWEPMYGSRANRARQAYYDLRGLSMCARGAMDVGFLFGLSSNAIPATGWMLMHILDPDGDQTLMGRVMGELEKARRESGRVDIPTLVASPLLQSILHEILRLYVDVLVTRDLKEDLILPLDGGKRQLLLKKSGIVMAPSWLGHRDEGLWTSPPCNVFYAERFMAVDPETGKDVFTTAETNGKFFPWGGGKSICPGRVFAKQEVLASLATVLLTFDLEVLGFLDAQGKAKKSFPGIKQAYSGTGIVAMDGDIKIRMRRRSKAGFSL